MNWQPMAKVGPQIISRIDSFLKCVNDHADYLFKNCSEHPNQCAVDIYKKYKEILEKIRMNTAFWKEVIDDSTSFLAVKNNENCCIGDFYDIINMIFDGEQYKILLNWFSNGNNRQDYPDGKYSKYLKYSKLTIASKAEIAKSHRSEAAAQGLEIYCEIYENVRWLEERRKFSNEWCNIYDNYSRDLLIEHLIKTDYFLLEQLGVSLCIYKGDFPKGYGENRWSRGYYKTECNNFALLNVIYYPPQIPSNDFYNGYYQN